MIKLKLWILLSYVDDAFWILVVNMSRYQLIGSAKVTNNLIKWSRHNMKQYEDLFIYKLLNQLNTSLIDIDANFGVDLETITKV